MLIINPATSGQNNNMSAYRNPGFGPNWIVLILPYLEQQGLYGQYAQAIENFVTSNGADQTWRGIRTRRMPLLLCPADPQGGHIPFALNGGGWARGNYGANAGPGWLHYTANGDSSTSVGSPGGTSAGMSAGGLMGVNWGVFLPRVGDGTSNTVMLAEMRTGLNPSDRRGVWAMGLAGSSVIAAAAIGDATNPNDSNEYSDDIEDCEALRAAQNVPATSGLGQFRMGCSNDNKPQNWPNWQAQARSIHLDGVNVCFSDGAVRWLSHLVPQNVWYLHLSRNDGAPIPGY